MGIVVPKKDRVTIYTSLFKDGVMVAKKDFNLPKHSQLDVKNLFVIKLMQSLKSRGYVRENFAWRHYYWYLTEEGINYLREFLHLSEEVVPATLVRTSRPQRPMGEGRPGRNYEGRGDRDRDSYRRRGEMGGFGRGGARAGAM